MSKASTFPGQVNRRRINALYNLERHEQVKSEKSPRAQREIARLKELIIDQDRADQIHTKKFRGR